MRTKGVVVLSLHGETACTPKGEWRERELKQELSENTLALSLKMQSRAPEDSPDAQEIFLQDIVWSAKDLGLNEQTPRHGDFYRQELPKMPAPSEELISELNTFSNKLNSPIDETGLYLIVHYENDKFSNLFKGKALAEYVNALGITPAEINILACNAARYEENEVKEFLKHLKLEPRPRLCIGYKYPVTVDPYEFDADTRRKMHLPTAADESAVGRKLFRPKREGQDEQWAPKSEVDNEYKRFYIPDPNSDGYIEVSRDEYLRAGIETTSPIITLLRKALGLPNDNDVTTRPADKTVKRCKLVHIGAEELFFHPIQKNDGGRLPPSNEVLSLSREHLSGIKFEQISLGDEFEIMNRNGTCKAAPRGLGALQRLTSNLKFSIPSVEPFDTSELQASVENWRHTLNRWEDELGALAIRWNQWKISYAPLSEALTMTVLAIESQLAETLSEVRGPFLHVDLLEKALLELRESPDDSDKEEAIEVGRSAQDVFVLVKTLADETLPKLPEQLAMLLPIDADLSKKIKTAINAIKTLPAGGAKQMVDDYLDKLSNVSTEDRKHFLLQSLEMDPFQLYEYVYERSEPKTNQLRAAAKIWRKEQVVNRLLERQNELPSDFLRECKANNLRGLLTDYAGALADNQLVYLVQADDDDLMAKASGPLDSFLRYKRNETETALVETLDAAYLKYVQPAALFEFLKTKTFDDLLDYDTLRSNDPSEFLTAIRTSGGLDTFLSTSPSERVITDISKVEADLQSRIKLVSDANGNAHAELVTSYINGVRGDKDPMLLTAFLIDTQEKRPFDVLEYVANRQPHPQQANMAQLKSEWRRAEIANTLQQYLHALPVQELNGCAVTDVANLLQEFALGMNDDESHLLLLERQTPYVFLNAVERPLTSFVNDRFHRFVNILTDAIVQKCDHLVESSVIRDYLQRQPLGRIEQFHESHDNDANNFLEAIVQDEALLTHLNALPAENVITPQGNRRLGKRLSMQPVENHERSTIENYMRGLNTMSKVRFVIATTYMGPFEVLEHVNAAKPQPEARVAQWRGRYIHERYTKLRDQIAENLPDMPPRQLNITVRTILDKTESATLLQWANQDDNALLNTLKTSIENHQRESSRITPSAGPQTSSRSRQVQAPVPVEPATLTDTLQNQLLEVAQRYGWSTVERPLTILQGHLKNPDFKAFTTVTAVAQHNDPNGGGHTIFLVGEAQKGPSYLERRNQPTWVVYPNNSLPGAFSYEAGKRYMIGPKGKLAPYVSNQAGNAPSTQSRR
ncbi:MAG TPA: hypothetical protein VM532_12435 [Burkholderiales bacterium]|nr:hypothetical protein [Burkholderiales bacterium]